MVKNNFNKQKSKSTNLNNFESILEKKYRLLINLMLIFFSVCKLFKSVLEYHFKLLKFFCLKNNSANDKIKSIYLHE